MTIKEMQAEIERQIAAKLPAGFRRNTMAGPGEHVFMCGRWVLNYGGPASQPDKPWRAIAFERDVMSASGSGATPGEAIASARGMLRHIAASVAAAYAEADGFAP